MILHPHPVRGGQGADGKCEITHCIAGTGRISGRGANVRNWRSAVTPGKRARRWTIILPWPAAHHRGHLGAKAWVPGGKIGRAEQVLGADAPLVRLGPQRPTGRG